MRAQSPDRLSSRPILLRIAAKALTFVVPLLVAFACNRPVNEDRRIRGQWAIEMQAESSMSASVRTARGVFVFTNRIRTYPGPLLATIDEPILAGRSYIDLRPLVSVVEDSTYRFSPRPEADLLEEAVATVFGDSVLVVLAPHVTTAAVTLRGAL